MRIGICEKCHYHEEVISKEVGTVLNICEKFKKRIDDLQPPIEKCTSFFSRGIPALFHTEALLIGKDK